MSLCISFIDLSTRRNIEQTPSYRSQRNIFPASSLAHKYSKLIPPILKGQKREIVWLSFFHRSSLYGTQISRLKRYRFFRFHEVYFYFSMNPRYGLQYSGDPTLFLKIPNKWCNSIDIRASSCHELFSRYCPINLVSSQSNFDVWIPNISFEPSLQATAGIQNRRKRL
jgi:hypothetical protein